MEPSDISWRVVSTRACVRGLKAWMVHQDERSPHVSISREGHDDSELHEFPLHGARKPLFAAQLDLRCHPDQQTQIDVPLSDTHILEGRTPSGEIVGYAVTGQSVHQIAADTPWLTWSRDLRSPRTHRHFRLDDAQSSDPTDSILCMVGVN